MVRRGDTQHHIGCGRWYCTTTNCRSYKRPRQSKHSSHILRQENTVCRPCSKSVFYAHVSIVSPLYGVICYFATARRSRPLAVLLVYAIMQTKFQLRSCYCETGDNLLSSPFRFSLLVVPILRIREHAPSDHFTFVYFVLSGYRKQPTSNPSYSLLF